MFLLATAVAATALVLWSGSPARQTLLQPLEYFFTFQQGEDSWRPMARAYDFVRTPEGRTRSLYRAHFFNPPDPHKGFQYPPTALIVVAGARAVGGGTPLLQVLNWLFVPVIALATGLVLKRSLEREGLAGAGTAERSTLVFWCTTAVAALTFYPALVAYRNGQIQAWLNGLFAVSLALYLKGRERPAGALLGACALIKPQWGVLLLWGLVRRRTGFSLSFSAVLALGALASLLLFGLAPHVEYLEVVRYIGARGEAFYPNQSMNGLLNRLLGNGLNLEWEDTFPPPHALVQLGTHLAAATLLATALWPPRRGAGDAFDLSLATIAATAASPIAWEHHYGMLLPVFALLLPAVLAHAGGRRPVWLLALAYVLCSQSWRSADRLVGTPFSVLQAYLYFGALLLMGLLVWARSRARESGPH